MTNISKAQHYAAEINGSEEPLYQIVGRAPDGAVGEDSDFLNPFWRVGGNAVVCFNGEYATAARWHDFIRECRYLRYRP
jgi:hypothetical protein